MTFVKLQTDQRTKTIVYRMFVGKEKFSPLPFQITVSYVRRYRQIDISNSRVAKFTILKKTLSQSTF